MAVKRSSKIQSLRAAPAARRGFAFWTPVDSAESGQSIIEFMFLLPMLVGLAVLLVRVNTAIQISIVNQQYARQHVLFLTYSSPVYPRIRIREDSFIERGFNQMLIGVSENLAPEGSYVPKASTKNIARKPKLGSNDVKSEPSERGEVRVRTTVSLCTQPNVINFGSSGGGSLQPILPLKKDQDNYVAVAPYNMPETAKFEYCRSPLQ